MTVKYHVRDGLGADAEKADVVWEVYKDAHDREDGRPTRRGRNNRTGGDVPAAPPSVLRASGPAETAGPACPGSLRSRRCNPQPCFWGKKTRPTVPAHFFGRFASATYKANPLCTCKMRGKKNSMENHVHFAFGGVLSGC